MLSAHEVKSCHTEVKIEYLLKASSTSPGMPSSTLLSTPGWISRVGAWYIILLGRAGRMISREQQVQLPGVEFDDLFKAQLTLSLDQQMHPKSKQTEGD